MLLRDPQALNPRFTWDATALGLQVSQKHGETLDLVFNYCVNHRLSGIIHVLYAALNKNLAMQSAPVTVQADDLSEEFPDSDHDGAATDNPANSTHVCDLTSSCSSMALMVLYSD